MSELAQASNKPTERPMPLRVLVGAWGAVAGISILVNLSMLVRAATGDVPTYLQPTWLAEVRAGGGLLAAAVILAACFALYHLRRSALPLFTLCVVCQLSASVISALLQPAARTWNVTFVSMSVVSAVVTLGYVRSLKSRGMLA